MKVDAFADHHTDTATYVLMKDVRPVRVIAQFTVDGEPVSKSRPRFTKRGRTYTPQHTIDAEQRMGWAFRQAARRHKPTAEARFGVFAIFFNGTRQRRDVDNMLKLICDGLNGVAWDDDDQVVEISGRKSYCDRKDARTEVLIYEVPFYDVGRSKPCAECGKEMKVYPSRGRTWCSHDCRGKAMERPRTCAHCGSEFSARKRDRGETKWCSNECSHLGRTTEVPCAHCATPVRIPRSLATQGNKGYCDDECRQNYWRPIRAKAARGTCEVCGKHTSKKSYRRCQGCHRLGLTVDEPGKSQGVTS